MIVQSLGIEKVHVHSTRSTDDDEASLIIDRQNSLLAKRGARVQPSASLVKLLGDS